jgi:hypothetical protein
LYSSLCLYRFQLGTKVPVELGIFQVVVFKTATAWQAYRSAVVHDLTP